MFSHSRTKKAEKNLIRIYACNVFTDWKLKQQLSRQYNSSIFDVQAMSGSNRLGSPSRHIYIPKKKKKPGQLSIRG